MSIQGPSSSPFRLPGGAYPARPAAPAAGSRAAKEADAASATPAANTAAAASEPTLWDLLTAEERDFFQQAAALGSITYRPSRAAAVIPAAPTGQRLDVRG